MNGVAVKHGTPERETEEYGTTNAELVKRGIPNPEWLNVEQQIQNDKTQNNKSKMIKCGITNLLRPKEAYQYFSGIICCLIFILISIFVNRNQIEY